MAWDFSTEPQFQEQLDWVEEFCRTEVEPLDLVFPGAAYSRNPQAKALADPLRQQVKDRGLWALFLDQELGGPGFGQLKLALLNEILGRYRTAPVIFGTAAPDTGNMEMLAAYGTAEQKEKWLDPLMNQEIFSAYSMTEPQGGSDPRLFQTRATRDGDEWVINGEKWFTSAGCAGRHHLRDVRQRDVRGAAGHARRADHGLPGRCTTTSATTTSGSRWATCSAPRTAPGCWPSGAWAAAASTTRCARWPRSSWPST